MIRRIAVATSGHDVPGMNAAIRAVTHSALDLGWSVMGVRMGYAGLVNGEFIPLTDRAVGGVMQRGGTFLGSAPSEIFLTEAGRKTALHHLAQHEIDALVVIGGDGSLSGAHALSAMGFPVNGVPSSLENDLSGTDIALGVDTALNIALDGIDNLKVAASSDNRAFLVEVAGQKSGYIALMAGIAGGAEVVDIPEIETTPVQIVEAIQAAYARGKAHPVIVVSEGASCQLGALVQHLKDSGAFDFDPCVTILTYVQRGGNPTAFDRVLGSRLGVCAVEALARGEYGVMAGTVGERIHTAPLAEIIGKPKPIDERLLRLAGILAV